MESIVSQEHCEITDKNIASSMYTLAFGRQPSALSFQLSSAPALGFCSFLGWMLMA